MDLTRLSRRFTDATDHAENGRLPDYFADAVAQINEQYQPLVSTSVGEWCGEFYRTEFEAYETGNRIEPLCRCPDPRCSLKRGRLPYQLRRPTRDEETPHEQLQAFIRSHTQPVVIDEALTELNAQLQQVDADITAVNRAAEAYLTDGEEVLSDRLRPETPSMNTDTPTPSPMGGD
jgi:hypothetical protein